MLDDPKKTESSSVGIAPQERRRYPRYQISATAEAVDLKSGTRIHGRVGDVGRGGCYVDTISPFPVGAEVKLRATKDNKSFTCTGKVFNSTVGMGMGVGFTGIEPEQLPVLERWIAELSGGVAPDLEALEEKEVVPREESSQSGLRNAVNEIIIALMRKRVLTDAEGKAMLQKLLH